MSFQAKAKTDEDIAFLNAPTMYILSKLAGSQSMGLIGQGFKELEGGKYTPVPTVSCPV